MRGTPVQGQLCCSCLACISWRPLCPGHCGYGTVRIEKYRDGPAQNEISTHENERVGTGTDTRLRGCMCACALLATYHTSPNVPPHPSCRILFPETRRTARPAQLKGIRGRHGRDTTSSLRRRKNSQIVGKEEGTVADAFREHLQEVRMYIKQASSLLTEQGGVFAAVPTDC